MEHECLECGEPAQHVHPAWSYGFCCSQCLPCEIELETERLQDEIEMLNERLIEFARYETV